MAGGNRWDRIDDKPAGYFGTQKGAALADYSSLIALARAQTTDGVAGARLLARWTGFELHDRRSVMIDGGIVMS